MVANSRKERGIVETCTNNPTKDLEQVLRMYEHTKSERDNLQNILSETIHYLVKQIEVYENEDFESGVEVLKDVLNRMQDIEKENEQ